MPLLERSTTPPLSWSPGTTASRAPSSQHHSLRSEHRKAPSHGVGRLVVRRFSLDNFFLVENVNVLLGGCIAYHVRVVGRFGNRQSNEIADGSQHAAPLSEARSGCGSRLLSLSSAPSSRCTRWCARTRVSPSQLGGSSAPTPCASSQAPRFPGYNSRATSPASPTADSAWWRFKVRLWHPFPFPFPRVLLRRA